MSLINQFKNSPHEKILVWGGALASVFLLYAYVHQQSGGSYAGLPSAGGATTDTTGTTTVANGNGVQDEIDALVKQINDLSNKSQTSVEYKLALDNSNQIQSATSGGSSNTGTGGGLLNVFGLFSLGGGGSKATGSQYQYAQNDILSDKSSIDVILQNASSADQQHTRDWITDILGTKEQQAYYSEARVSDAAVNAIAVASQTRPK